MESALRPREIQARIRAGESMVDVAEAAGVDVERIDVYAGPVLAEREHVATMAQTSSLRRRGEATGHQTLRSMVHQRLLALGVELEQLSWDAWKRADRKWSVRASYLVDGAPVEAEFGFDLPGRFSVAENEVAAALIGEVRRGGDGDLEPTIDLDDEFALVRAVAEPEAELAGAPSETPPSQPATVSQIQAPPYDPQVGSATSPVDVYEVLPAPESELDVLYDMLGGFNEDSVKIYAGLAEPVTDEPITEAPSDSAPQEPPKQRKRRGRRSTRAASVEPGQSHPAASADAKPTPTKPTAAEPTEATAAQPTEPTAPQSQAPLTEPEQPPLLADGAGSPPAKPRSNKKRASVPSWDEIMFGAPKR